MDVELVLWIILPMAAAVALMVVSLYCLGSDFRPVQAMLSLPVVLLMLSAMSILESMRAGAWPTYLPHIAIMLGALLAFAQALLVHRRRRVEPDAVTDSAP